MEETTFHSTKHRQRDNVIQQKHEAELHRYKVLLDKQKYINDELRVSLFDIKNRSKTLVDNLGFPDLIEAQVYLDGLRSKGQVVEYRERFRDIERLVNELKEAKMFNQKMEVRERELEEENTTLRQARHESASAFRQLTKEYKNLEEKHRESVKAHEAASSRRDKDYAKWESFKKWILCAAEVAQFQKYDKEFGFSGKDKAKELLRIVTGKKYKLSQLKMLDDETLFNASEQDPKELHLIFPPGVAQPDKSTSSTLCTSSKVNQPVEDQAPSFTPPPLPKLIRSYAMKHTSIPPTREDSKDNHSASIRKVEPERIAPVEQITSLLAPVPGSQTEDESQLPHLPSTVLAALVASKPKTAVVLAPDSEPEDDSQPFRHSQPPSNISQSVPKSTRIPLAFKEIPSSTLAGHSNPSSRRALQLFHLASTPTPTNRPSLPLSSFFSNGFESSTGLERDSRQDNDHDQYPEHLSQSLLPIYASPILGDHEDDEPPRKYRRASEGNRVPSGSSIGARTSPAAATPASTTTSKPRQRRRSSLETSRSRSRPRVGDRDRERDRERILDKENTSASHARNSERRKSDGHIEKDQDQGQDRDRSYDIERNGKGKEKAALTKKGPLDDYSIYKGRGRYGKDKEKNRGVETTTINERYAIDPSRNGGLEYEYDEVVRGKEKRKRLLGGDCDDCREYYRAIGPMPPRLQAPLWKSPAKSSSVSPCRLHGHGHSRQHTSISAKRRREEFDFDDGIFDDFDTPSRGPPDRRRSPSRARSPGRSSRYRRNEIDTHKQKISRHRAAWERGTTPPGYWDIGFPNTQMTEEINEKAREIHERKMEKVEREAAREGGRYRKR